MDDSIDLVLNYNEYGVVDCTSKSDSNINSNLKLKLDQFVNRIIQDSPPSKDEIDSIEISKPQDEIHVAVKAKGNQWSLDKSKEVILLGKEVFNENGTEDLHNIFVNIPKKLANQKPTLPNVLRRATPIVDRLLAHILAGEFGADSELEGLQAVAVLEFLCKFFKDRSSKSPPYNIPESVLKDMSGAISYDVSVLFPQRITKYIQNSLKNNQPLLMTGGWIGNPAGHGMYYELIPGANAKSSLRLYNLGAGIESLDTLVVGSKSKAPAFVEWQGIPNENLINPAFATVLHELQRKDRTTDGTLTNYSEKDIYCSLKEILMPESEEISYETKSPTTPQRGGWCSWKSILAYLKTKMDADSYKIFKCDVKLQVLIDNYDSKGFGSLSEMARWRLIKKSLASISRSIDKLYESKIVTKEYLEEAYELLKPINQWVKDNKKITLKGKSHPTIIQGLQYTPLSKMSTKSPWEKGKLLIPAQPLDFGQSQNIHKKGDLLEFMRKMNKLSLDAVNVEFVLNEVYAAVKAAWLKADDYESHAALDMLIDRLSMDKSFWGDVAGKDPEKAKRLISQITELQSLYVKTCWTISRAEIVFPESVLHTYKLLYIQNHLAEIIEPDRWKELKPGGGDFDFFDQECPDHSRFHFHLYNPQQNEELLQIVEWLDQKSDAPINQDCNLKENGYSYAAHKFNNEISLADKICEMDTTLIPKVAKEVPGFAGMEKGERDAHVLMSSHLPVWIDSMLKSCALARSLSNDSVFRPASLNRGEDLNLIKIYDAAENVIRYRLSGITLPKTDQKRFKQFFPPFQSDKLNMYLTGILNWSSAVCERYLVGERKLSQHLQNPIDIEEFKELAYLNLSPNLCIPSTLSFFERNDSYLFDPDYQQLFEMLVFQPGYLKKALELEGFSEKLVHFIETKLEKCVNNNQIQSAIFLSRLARYFNQFFQNDKLSEYQLPLLRKFLEIKGLDTYQKGAIYNQICANLSEKDILDERDIKDTLVGSVYLYRHPLPVNWTNEYVKRDIESNLRKHADQLENALFAGSKPNNQLLNTILKECKPEAKDENWEVIQKPGEFLQFHTTGSNYEYYPVTGELIYPGATVKLPYAITTHASFKKLFPEIDQGVQLKGNVFSFEDKKGIETRVLMKGGELTIDQKRGKHHPQWYRYVSPEILNFQDLKNIYSPLCSRYLVDHFHAWRKLDKHPLDLLLVDPINQKKAYRCSFENQNGVTEIKEIQRIKDGAVLSLNSNLMISMEDPQFIHEWYLKDNLSEVELPRYPLTFKVDKKDPSKLNCDQITGYFLKPDEVLIKAGSYRHYLVLEDKHGNKKAIFPMHHFGATKKEVFEPNYKINMNSQTDISEPQSYHVFDVMKNGKLYSKSREANLYLAEVSLLVQNYEQAAALLKQFGKKLSPYTLSEIELLTQMSSLNKVTGNIEGNAVGIQAYASYLLEKNLKDFPKEGAIKTNLAENYALYLDHINNINILKLSRDEELYIITQLNSKSISEKNRELELKKAVNKAPLNLPKNHLRTIVRTLNPSVCDFNKIKDTSYQPWERDEVLVLNDITQMPKPLSESKKLITLYDYVYELSDPEAINNLKAGLIFWKYDKRFQSNLKANLFTLILNHKQEFPRIPSNLNESNYKQWWSDVLNIANRLIEQHPPITVESINNSIDVGIRNVSQQPVEKIWIGSYKIQEIPPLKKDGLVGKQDEAWFTTTQRKKTSSVSSTSSNTQKKENIQDILDHLLVLTSGEDKINNALVENEVKRLKNDLVVYEKQPKTLHYNLNGNALNEIENFCTTIVTTSHKNQLSLLKNQILDLANKSPIVSFGRARKKLLEWGGKQRPFKLGELLINFGKQDPTALKERNPSLYPADIKLIYEKIGMYLQLHIQKQQAQRALATVNKLKALKLDPQVNTDSVEDLVQRLASDLTATRCYPLNDNPALLVFEYCEGILLRPQQIKMISDFLNNKDVEAVRELIMGSGKSKVLMPLLAFLRADGVHLSTLIVPEALLQSVSSDTQEILQEVYNISLHTLDFNRNTDFTIESLKNILEELKSIRNNKECLILTSKSVQCLLLKFIEKAIEHFKSPTDPKPMTSELTLMREILGILSNESYPLLDEADLLLNVLHEVSFSLGKRNAPIQQEIDLVGDLYYLLYTNKDLKKLARLESDPAGDPKAPILTEKLYHESLKKDLAKALVEHLKRKKFDDKPLQSTINAYFADLKDPNRELLLNYLCRVKGKEKEAQEFYHQQPKEIREILALAGEEISNLLPHSLLKSCDEKYGIDLEMQGVLAIPFSGAQTPSRGSEFANHHITMNYTLQSYVQKGIPRRLLITQINLLQESAKKEMLEDEGKKTLQDTTAWHIFKQIKGDLNLPFFNLTDQQIDILLEVVNRNTENRLKLTQKLILPQIVIFDRKISSNSHNLASFFNIWGFTGALWNGCSMHRKITPVRTEGTDAFTISTLWLNSYHAVHTKFSGSSTQMMNQLKDSGIEYDVLADAGGYFKEIDNLSNAKLLSTQLKKPVVFYDPKGNQAIWEMSETNKLAESPYKDKEDQRGTFLDQVHTTGADVTQKPRAIGLVTIGSNMILRDLLQAVWRLRGLDKSQHIEFIISDNVETLMRQLLKKNETDQLTFADILGFTIINQAERQGKDNIKAFNSELDEVSQKAFLDVLLSANSTPQDCSKAVQDLGSSWVKTSFSTADTLYGDIPIEEDSEKLRLDIMERYIKKTAKCRLTKNKEGEIRKIAEHFQGRLPPIMSTKAGNEDLTNEQEQQKIAQKQSELEVVNSASLTNTFSGEIIEHESLEQYTPQRFTPELYPAQLRTYPSITSDDSCLLSLGKFPLPVFPLKLYFDEFEELKKYANAFEGIGLSLGMLQIPDAKEIDLSDISFFGSKRKPIRYLMVNKDNTVTLLNNREAGMRIKKGFKNIYEMDLGSINSKDTICPEVTEKLTKIKFLNGVSRYTREEINILRKWIVEHGVKQMYDLFSKHSLQGQILKSRDYEHSSLQRLFHELMEDNAQFKKVWKIGEKNRQKPLKRLLQAQ